MLFPTPSSRTTSLHRKKLAQTIRASATQSQTLIKVTIVVMSRLVYRKGIDLLAASAPVICDLHPEVRFVVGGDGPKMVELEQMREKYQLQDRIELLGSVPPSGVRDVSVLLDLRCLLSTISRAGRITRHITITTISMTTHDSTVLNYRSWSEAKSTSTPPSQKPSASASSKPPQRVFSS